MSFDYTTLVTDRTQADVDAGNEKGTYNAADLNRVSECCNVIGDMMRSYGYAVPDPLRTDWAEGEIPRASEMRGYIRAVRSLCSLVVFMRDAPEITSTMERFGFESANDIERALGHLGPIAEKIPSTWVYCGTVFSGGIYL
ncbi:MAG: hypothetical protein IJX14_12205 [Clostridia bacterium]|nr:hypothetical protein [Clostridia bacterium]